MNATKITYELPKVLPHGWKREVARLLGKHRNTVTNALRKGKTHPDDPLYKMILKVATEKYGNIKKTEELA